MALTLRVRRFARDVALGLADAVEFVAGDGVTLAVTRLARDRLRLTVSAQGGGAVSSVFGRTGAVVAQSGDYTAAQVGADAAGTASAGDAAHVAAGDPHPQYATGAEVSGTAVGGDSSGTVAAIVNDRARGLRETAGPTTLAMGAVADGQYLKRSGSSIVGVYVALAITTLGNVQELLGASSPLTALTTSPGSVA